LPDEGGFVKFLIPLSFATFALAQQPAEPNVPQDHRPGLFFREDFKGPKAGVHIAPMTQEFIANPDLELKLYGAGKFLQIDHGDLPKDDPNFIWTGLTESSWGLALRDKTANVDLSGLSKIRWRTEQTGFHALHPIVKLANGTWLVGEYAEGWTPDWHESEFWPSAIRWRKLNIDRVLEAATGNHYINGLWEEKPDLSNVEEIGFTDLMAGSGRGEGGWCRIDWIEVYGNPVKRDAAPKTVSQN
jgi:hypothetical protein